MQQQFLIAGAALMDVLAMGTLMYMLPRVMRKDLFFAVTVPPEYRDTEEAAEIAAGFRKRILAQTALWVLVVGAATAVAATQPVREATALLLATLVFSLLGMAVGSAVTYFSSRRRVVPHSVAPSSRRDAALTPRPRVRPGGLLFLTFPFLMIAASALVCGLNWDRIPLRYPSHWGLDGKVDGWTVRTPMGVFWPLLLAALLNAVFLWVALIIPSGPRRLYPLPEASEHEMAARRLLGRLLVWVTYALTLPLCMIAMYLPLAPQSKNLPALLIILSMLGEFCLLALTLVTVTQVGEHLEKARKITVAAGGGAVIGDRTHDRYWKWGTFYVNPNDPAVWVENRSGVGFTPNLGQWQGRAWLVGMLGVPVFISGGALFFAFWR